MNHRTLYRMVMLVLGLALCVMPAFGQYRTGIQGVVTDQTGAVISGATLTLTNPATNQQVVRTSNEAGVYNFNALAAARFTLEVEKAGFQKKIIDNLDLVPEQTNALNIQLSVGAESQTVSVDASATPVIDTQTASITGVISTNQVQSMPSFGRDVFQLMQLAPGVFGDGSQGSGGGSSQIPGTQGPGGTGGNQGIFQTENGPQVLANGGQYENNGITIDGISTVSAVWGGTTIITPTEESVESVKVVSNGYDAENGRFSGAQIQVTSKSGSNQFHGSAFYNAHRPGLNAYQRFNGQGNKNLRDNLLWNQIGGSIGGPIWKSKVFGFFAYETARVPHSNVVSNAWYETSSFDASAPSGSIAAKFLTFPGAGVSSTGINSSATCQTAGLIEGVNCNTIPGKGLDVGSPLKTALGTHDLGWTSAHNPGVGGGLDGVADIANFVTSNPTTSSAEQYNGRLDADVTNKDRIGFAIYWVPQSRTNYNGTARAYNLFHHSQVNEAFSAIWNRTISPTFLNEARFNVAGWHWDEVSSNPQQPIGLPQDSIGDMGSVTPSFFGGSLGSVLKQWTYSYKDVATKVTGHHTIKFGGELTRLYNVNQDIGDSRPSYGFFNIWDFLNDAPRSESGRFDPRTGAPSTARQDHREDIWGFFAQDEFKLRRNLTINMGLRYSYFGPLSSKQNNMYSVVFGSGDQMVSGITIRKGGNLWEAQKGNFGPQVGFAWSPSQFQDKLVVRGGYGLNYNQEEIAISGNVTGNPGATVSPNFSMSLPTSANPGIVYSVSSDLKSLSGFPVNPNTISSYGSDGLPTTGTVGLTAFPNKLSTGLTHHYSVDTQYDLGHHTTATLGYQGSLSRNTYFHSDANAIAAAKGYALNPKVTSVNFFGNSGSGNYNAMLAGLKHQFSHQFMADAEFTWAKSMDTSSAPYSIQYYPYSSRQSYGRSDYNVGKAFKLYGMWQPVFFHGSQSWVEKVAGGWTISGILNIHSGFPWNPVVSVVGGSLYCSTCGYTTLLPADYLGGAGTSTSNDAYKTGSNYSKGGAAYYSTPTYTAYSGSGSSSYGSALPQAPNVHRNSLTGPGYRDIDMTLAKSFGLPTMPGLGEGAKFEIRADAYNLFNLMNLSPSSLSRNIANSNFGMATSALGARTISIQAKFLF